MSPANDNQAFAAAFMSGGDVFERGKGSHGKPTWFPLSDARRRFFEITSEALTTLDPAKARKLARHGIDWHAAIVACERYRRAIGMRVEA